METMNATLFSLNLMSPFVKSEAFQMQINGKQEENFPKMYIEGKSDQSNLNGSGFRKE